ncbi:interleukin-17 receptor C-like [Aplochiton taeniatus]
MWSDCGFVDSLDPHSELLRRNVRQNMSVSVVEGQTYSSAAMLSWNLSAPCRLEAEVLLCQRAAGVDTGGCLEIMGFRKKLANGTWKQNEEGQWEISGEFADVNIHLSLCVMVIIEGLELGPFCPYEISRWRQMLILPFVVLLVCLAVLLCYLLHNRVKPASRWHYGKCVQRARRRHVVLLSPPDTVEAVANLMCELGSLLGDRGLSVSVDLWSRADQCSLGPLPWLHSQLLRLDSRVVLVLTRAACLRAEEWTQRCRGQTQAAGASPLSSPYADVFSAALCCIQADQKVGRAGERFLLVNFESCQVQGPCPEAGLPTPLQGLPLFQLPSQTPALLSELTAGRQW